MTAKQIKWADFVEIWQTAASVPEVSLRYGKATSMRCSSIASYLRRNGVPLKKFSNNEPIDWDALHQIALMHLPPELRAEAQA